ncbi:MAG: D-2-hydroxyacid dehydrogenase [Rhodoplanes sp.]
MSLSIVFLDRATLAADTCLRSPAFPHTWDNHSDTTAADVARRAAAADIIVTNKVAINREALERLPHLKLIAVAATGVDRIDLAACRERGIVVSNVRGYAVHTVSEHTFALVLALRRNLFNYHEAVRRGRWREVKRFCFLDYPIGDLYGARLGIIGAGVIGRRVAEIAHSFGMVPMFAARKGQAPQGAEFVDWNEVLATSDIITLHCPLRPDTRDLIAMPEFRAMASRPLVINTARGGLINEADLVAALDENLIAGAGLDVSVQEPPAPDSPLMAVLDRPNVILTPHVAWASRAAVQTLADQLIDNIEAFAVGRPVNVV